MAEFGREADVSFAETNVDFQIALRSNRSNLLQQGGGEAGQAFDTLFNKRNHRQQRGRRQAASSSEEAGRRLRPRIFDSPDEWLGLAKAATLH